MTQKELVIEYIKEFGSITPAKISGFIYKGIMFGSETSKRCRELRASGVLESHENGKFEVFTLNNINSNNSSNLTLKSLNLTLQNRTSNNLNDQLRELLKRHLLVGTINTMLWKEIFGSPFIVSQT